MTSDPSKATKRFSVLPAAMGTCFSCAAIVAAVFLIAGINRTGIWDPHELDRAELARRIAVHVFHRGELALEGAANTMPTLSDLEAGELGFTSMAAGFAVWGLHEFAGRLPLALWCLAGALAAFAYMARAVSPRAGLFTVVVLCTMPAFFVQARTMLGDAVTMASFAMCFFGLAGALTERRWRPALLFFGLAMVGAIGGFASRGLLLGVAAPTLGAGFGWAALAAGGDDAWRTPRRITLGTGALVVGLVAGWQGAMPLFAHGHAAAEVTRRLAVSVLYGPPREATFDLAIRELGHGLYPWSALLPFAFGLLIVPRRAEPLPEPRQAARSLLLVGAATAYAVYTSVAPFSGVIAFGGITVLAAIVGVMIESLDDGPPMPVVAVGALGVLAILAHDMLESPDAGLAAFAIPGAELPIGVADSVRPYVVAATACFGVLVWLAWAAEPPSREGSLRARVARRVADYQRSAEAVGAIWAGNLAFGFLVVEAALVGMGATILIGRRLAWPSVASMPRTWASAGMNLWWVVPLALLSAPLVVDGSRRGFGWLLGQARAPRSMAMVVAALSAGALTCFGYYTAMAEQLSPKQALDAFASLHGAEERLGLLGVNPRMGRYYGGGSLSAALSSPTEAIHWLAADERGAPRWMVFRDSQLAELNRLHRAAHHENLPMVDSGGGKVLLATSRGGQVGANPLDAWVLSEPPRELQHPLKARFSDQLDVLGWDVVDDEGRSVAEVEVGRDYHMRLYLAVLRRINRSYRAFIHIDAAGRRHNGDHDVLDGLYPMTFWQPGDIIVDEHRFQLERHFFPGRYAVYFGYYVHKDRLPVSEGQHSDDRLYGGMLTVK